MQYNYTTENVQNSNIIKYCAIQRYLQAMYKTRHYLATTILLSKVQDGDIGGQRYRYYQAMYNTTILPSDLQYSDIATIHSADVLVSKRTLQKP